MNETATILVVDDDPEIQKLTAQLLQANGLKARTASSTAEADRVLAEGHIDLIVLDIMMPDEDGRQFCQRIRQSSRIPIIMLTAMRADIDLVVGLELGADDYVKKPFTPLELVARIKTVLRRAVPEEVLQEQTPPRQYAFAEFVLDVEQRRLMRTSGAEVELTSGEFALLLTLIESRPRVLSRDQLLDATRGASANPFDRSIDTHISRLRKKIEPDPKRGRFIKTVRNLGYAFAPEIKSVGIDKTT